MKWRVEFNGAVDVEAETEAEAIAAGFKQLLFEGSENLLFADADVALEIPTQAALTEELAYTKGIVAQYEADEFRRGKEVADNRQS